MEGEWLFSPGYVGAQSEDTMRASSFTLTSSLSVLSRAGLGDLGQTSHIVNAATLALRLLPWSSEVSSLDVC